MYPTTYKVPGRSPEQATNYTLKVKKRIDPLFLSGREGFVLNTRDTDEISTIVNNIRSNYSSIDVQKARVNAEVEVRFGMFVYNERTKSTSFEPGVSKREFERLRSTLDRLKLEKENITSDVIYTGYSNSRRKIVSNNVEVWEDKTRIGDWNIPLMNLRLSISDERKVEKMEMRSMPTLIRSRSRMSYYLPGKHNRVDLTTVQVIQKNNQNVADQLIVSYEVEVELIQHDMNEFYKGIGFVYRQIYGSQLLYTVPEREEFIKYYNNLVTPPFYKTLQDSTKTKRQKSICYKFSGQQRDKVEVASSFLNKPRALKFKDLTWGNLVGNPKTIYRIGHKADGVRKSIVFKDKNIWLVSDPDEIDLIYLGKTDAGIPNNTVLEGEIISQKNKMAIGVPAKRLMLLFDTLVYAGEQSVQNLSHTERMDKGKFVSKALVNMFTQEGLESEPNIDMDENTLLHLYKFSWNGAIDFDTNRKDLIKTKIKAPKTYNGAPILLLTKYFKATTTPESFFAVMKSMLHVQGYTSDPTTSYKHRAVSYDTDGLMMIAERSPYKFYKQHEEDKPWMHKEVAYLEQIKWKPYHTIDMTVVIRNNGIEILVFDNETEVRFTGTDRYPLNYADVDFSHPLADPNVKNLSSCTVYEFRWDGSKLYPAKYRPDKLFPNSLFVAQQTWDLIHKPITEEILIGNTMELVFKSHNREKAALYKSVYKKNDDLTYADFGAGNLGDLDKYRFRKVLAVEPYAKHIAEARRRLANSNIQDRVRIVEARVQDTSIVYNNLIDFIGGQVDVVGSMFSMTFFWDSLDNLMKLVELIDLCLKPGGKFIFTVMNGDAIEQAYKPAFGGNWLSSLDAGLYKIDWPNKMTNELKINIPGRSVNNQTEYLFRIDDLIFQLGKRGYTLDYTKSLTDEKLLTVIETIYTGFFMAGVFTKPLNQNTRPNTQVVVPIAHPVIQPTIQPMVPGLEGFTLIQPPVQPSAIVPSVQMPSETVQVGLPGLELDGVPGIVPSSPLVVDATAPGASNVGLQPPIRPHTPLTVSVSQSLVVPGLDTINPINIPPINNVLPGSPNSNMPVGILPGGVLPNIPLTFPIVAPQARMVSSIGPDAYEIIKVTNYPYTVLRLGALGDGSCFIHAILKACYAPYQENTIDKRSAAQTYRAAIARWIVLPSYENPYKRNIEYVAGGSLYKFMQETSGVNIEEGVNGSFTVENLYNLINSCAFVGDEVYQILAEVTGMDMIVVLMKTDGLHYQADTYINIRPKRKTIIIGGNGKHYETIALYTQGGIQTIFDPDHPLLATILSNRHNRNFV